MSDGAPNPATELLQILGEWRASPGSANRQRRDVHPDIWTDGDARHVRAAELVAEVIRAIDQLERNGRQVGLYRAQQASMLAAILCLRTTAWDTGSPASADVPDLLISVVEHLSDVLDHRENEALNPAAVAGLKSLLAEILVLASNDDEIDDRLANHIRAVVRHLEDCIDDFETYGESEAMSAWDAVWVALQAAMLQSTSHRGAWTAFKDRFFWPTATGLLANAPSLALQVQQITAGTGLG